MSILALCLNPNLSQDELEKLIKEEMARRQIEHEKTMASIESMPESPYKREYVQQCVEIAIRQWMGF